ncbi:MAG: site-specific DNA-methyltransferase [Candidatus Micrarchaeia archaeon]
MTVKSLKNETKNTNTLIPNLAKNIDYLNTLPSKIASISTTHRLIFGDARNLSKIENETVQLVVTSPPYWTLKEYNQIDGQLGHIQDYAIFLEELDKIWTECFRVLIPGGRLIIVVGDVCLSRKKHGRHQVIPLHADIQTRCRNIGFDNLASIIWHKIANAKYEVKGNGKGFLGKPYEPNAIIKNDVEFILMERKPGGYRKPTDKTRLLSLIPQEKYKIWFTQVWEGVRGASTKVHPAPFPEELADRLIRMYSFVGDTVLDPFLGTGTTTVAALKSGRNSLGVELDPKYLELAKKRINATISESNANATLLLE